jgi:hypothetical protein
LSCQETKTLRRTNAVFVSLKFRPVVRASKPTPLAVRIVGAAVHRQHDYLGTDVDPRIEIGDASPKFQQRAAGIALSRG